eukprot:COSAG01_NODE_5161_length_4439_cov_6.008291_5_plen_136_part_00
MSRLFLSRNIRNRTETAGQDGWQAAAPPARNASWDAQSQPQPAGPALGTVPAADPGDLMSAVVGTWALLGTGAGAGGDHGIAHVQNRREISASSGRDPSHDLHPHPWLCVVVVPPHASRPPTRAPRAARCGSARV